MSENPYQTPKSNLVDDDQSVIRKRTGWIWVIIILNCLGVFGNIFSLLLFVVLPTDFMELPEESKTIIEQQGIVDFLLIVMNTILMALAAINLFKLSKIATKLFIIDFVLSIIITLYYALFTNFYQLDISFFAEIIVVFSISVLIIWYCFKLEKKKILI